MDIEYSNFVLLETQGNSPTSWVFIAKVDETTTTGMWWWKTSTTTRKKIRRVYANAWHYVDTGGFTHGHDVENLARAWTAQTGEPT